MPAFEGFEHMTPRLAWECVLTDAHEAWTARDASGASYVVAGYPNGSAFPFTVSVNGVTWRIARTSRWCAGKAPARRFKRATSAKSAVEAELVAMKLGPMGLP